MTVSNLIRLLYRIARVSRDVQVIASGSPSKMGKRAWNKVIARRIVSRLFWR